MSKLTRAMRLLADLSPEERNELLNEYKETNGLDSEQGSQDTLKETDKGGSTEEVSPKVETAPQSVEETETAKEEQNSNESEETQPKSTTEQVEQAPNVQDSVEVGEEVGSDFIAQGRDINDFVTKEDLKALMDTWQTKANALEQENKALKEELDKAKSDNQDLKDKYEGDNFGDISQMFKSDKSEEKKITQSYADFFNDNFK